MRQTVPITRRFWPKRKSKLATAASRPQPQNRKVSGSSEGFAALLPKVSGRDAAVARKKDRRIECTPVRLSFFQHQLRRHDYWFGFLLRSALPGWPGFGGGCCCWRICCFCCWRCCCCCAACC